MTNVNLTDDEKYIFFELLTRIDEKKLFDGLAEELVLNNVIAELEPQMDKIFNPDYDIVVQKAKDRFLKPYLEE